MTIQPFPSLQAPNRTPLEGTLIQRINDLLQGRVNVTLEVTLTAGVGTTTVKDARFSKQSFVGFMPLTASAATEMAAGTLRVSSQTFNEITITHVNSGVSDRSFRLLIIG
jgi:hypothetical protein